MNDEFSKLNEKMSDANGELNNNMNDNNMSSSFNNSMNNVNNNSNNTNNMNSNFNNNMNNMNNNPNNHLNNMNNDSNNNINNMNNNFNNNMNNMHNDSNNSMNNMSNRPMNNSQFQSYPSKKSNIGLIIGIVGVLVVVGVGLLLYFLVFSGSKVLKCTMFQSISGISTTSTLELKFKKDYFVSGTMSEIVDASSLSAEQLNIVKQTDLCQSITAGGNSAVSFSNCKQNVKGSSINVSVDLLPGEDATEKVNVDDGKELFESMGFKCE